MLRKILFILVISLVITDPLKAQKDYKVNASTAIKANDADLCSLAAARMEEKYGIKTHLLQTISSVETGRWDYNKEKFVSWPWTINANGKGKHFDTKDEAIAEVKRLQADGVKSIDVGCMQISLKYHADAFESIEQAFEPETNELPGWTQRARGLLSWLAVSLPGRKDKCFLGFVVRMRCSLQGFLYP